MGRLDDAAKRKVVELREAGLSFRKIKAVLELENIKVSAQAIYLFLKEFHGRGRQNDASVSGNSGTTTVSESIDTRLCKPRHGGWSEQQLRSLLREAAHVAGFSSPPDSGQSGIASEYREHPSGTGHTNQEPLQADKKDEDVRIISVTSLAQNTHHNAIQSSRSGFSSGAIAGTFTRKRYTPSPANPVLVARKRLLDKALFHRARVRDCGPQSAQQSMSLVRRDQSCLPYSEGRKVMLPQTTSFNQTSTRSVRGPFQGTSISRQGFPQRANIPARSTEQSPRVGIRIPVQGQSSSVPQNSGPSVRVQASGNQLQSSASQQSCLDTGTLSALQEQVKSLASEVCSLGLALRMMIEQQGRLEREQSQQTQVQKQILSTLQKLASKQGPFAFQHCTTPTVPPCPLSSASYSQSTFTSSQGGSMCSQAQSRYNEIDGSTIDNIEPFSLTSLSSATIDGFQTSDSLSFNRTHSPTCTQSHTHTPEIVSYTQSHKDTYAGMESKSAELASPSTDRSFQACRSSSLSSTEAISGHNAQLNIVKIENV
ncbi:hypothetical protein Baya_4311 [Bagarius yarrelli]|uniref:Uncharacterized protein n=1 Tax=Bagarius yarrelli TaxID=175774 RepID=A0A556TW13_BAGYA|nr:hypothetical protein Baya_4311 [Bagarius yarrelli]